MPGRRNDERAQRDGTVENLENYLEEAANAARIVGGMLDDADQLAAGAAWATLANEIESVLERARKMAR